MIVSIFTGSAETCRDLFANCLVACCGIGEIKVFLSDHVVLRHKKATTTRRRGWVAVINLIILIASDKMGPEGFDPREITVSEPAFSAF